MSVNVNITKKIKQRIDASGRVIKIEEVDTKDLSKKDKNYLKKFKK